MATAESLRSEFIIEVTGQVAAREQANDKLPTGAVRVERDSSYSAEYSQNNTFEIKDGIEANDDTFALPLPWPSSSRDVGKSQTSLRWPILS